LFCYKKSFYNLLDKPDSLVISGKATLYYCYDEGGNKLKKVTVDYSMSGKTVLPLAFLNSLIAITNEPPSKIKEKPRTI
jgi:hypothetical protein